MSISELKNKLVCSGVRQQYRSAGASHSRSFFPIDLSFLGLSDPALNPPDRSRQAVKRGRFGFRVAGNSEPNPLSGIVEPGDDR